MRTIVTHIHLFKNAGTSVEQALERSLGPRWTSYDGDTASALLSAGALAQFLHDRPGVEAVSSHHIRPPLAGAPRFVFLPLVFLRHPIDRIRSAYDFERQQGAPTPSSVAAGSMNLSDWIDFHRNRRSSQVAEFQTLALSALRDESGRPSPDISLDAHRASAMSLVADLPAYGLVEKFDDSCRWINAWLREVLPSLELAPEHANSTQDRSAALSARLDQVRENLGPAAYTRLLDDNAQDLLLWDWATNRAEPALANLSTAEIDEQ